MKRREILLGAGLTVGAGFNFPTPAIATGKRNLTMVTDWPEGPGVLTSARRLARTIDDASGGRLRIEVSASGEVVRPFDTFDAVQAGIADMFHSHIGYFEKKSPAFQFYSGVPFGLTPNELFAWVRFGGGQGLWDELAGQFGIKPLLCCSTGMQMGGWFRDKIESVEDLKGLRYRMAGSGAEVYRRLGAAVILLPPADIVQALRSGAIDACEWVGPWLDTVMGLDQVARHYYYPGWHEPGTALALGINQGVWESLEEADRKLIETAAASEYTVSLAEFDTNNAMAMRDLRMRGDVELHRFDDAMLRTFAGISEEVVAEAGASDDIARAIYRSYQEFRELVSDWSESGEGAYLGVRGRR